MRLPLLLGLSVLFTATFAATATADSVTIDFNELTSKDPLIHSLGGVYSVDGFTFTAVIPSYAGNTPDFETAGTLSSTFDGSTSLFNGNALSTTVLTRSDGGRFNLFSIDLAETPNFDGTTGKPIDLGSFSLTFYGTRANHSVVEATATIGPFPSITTFTFSGFSDLISVEWTQGPGGVPGPTHQFDNVRVNEVPEPRTLLLLVTGVLTVGRWRTTRSSSPPVGKDRDRGATVQMRVPVRRFVGATLLALLSASGIMACSDGPSAPSSLTTPAAATTAPVAPTLISVTLDGTAPAIGGSSQFTATANYSDATTKAIATLASWTSSSNLVAIVSVNGLVTATGAGNTNIGATYLGVTGLKLVSIAPLAAPVPTPTPTPTPVPTPSTLVCNGVIVPSIVACPNNGGNQAPTAQCNDGTYSCSQNRSGTCSTHSGVSCYVCPGPLC